MPWWRRPKPLAFLLTAALAAFGGFELYYDLLGLPWPGTDFGYRLAAAGFGLLWLATAVLLWTGPAVLLITSALSIATMVAHGIMVTLGGSRWGALFLLGGIALLVLTSLANEATREKRVSRPEERKRDTHDLRRAA